MAAPSALAPARFDRARTFLRERPFSIEYAGIALAYVLIRVVEFSRAAPSKAGDSLSYTEVAKLDPFSAGFLAGPRGWTVPLFYKILGSDQLRIDGQLLLSLVCWLALAWTVAGLVRSRALALGGFAAILAFSLTAPIVGWDSLLLSDSVGISLGAAVIALGLRFSRRPAPATAAGIVAVSLLWAFARDTNAYLVLFAAIAALVAVRFGSRRWVLGGTAAALVVVFVLTIVSIDGGATSNQAAAAFRGPALGANSFGRDAEAYRHPAQQYFLFGEGRWEFPLLNVIGTRVLTDPGRLRYFTDHGMPVNATLLVLRGETAAGAAGAFYRSPQLASFRSWLDAHGQATYMRYLLTHPRYTLQPLWHKDALRGVLFPPWTVASNSVPLDPQRPLHAVPSVIPAPLGKLVFSSSGFDVVFWLAAVLLAAFLAVRRRWSRLWFVPVLLIVTTIPHFLLVWHGDAQDVTRHGLEVALLLRLGLILLLVVALDSERRGARPRRA